METILDGRVYTHDIDEWKISWKSHEEYRHWCVQKHPSNFDYILVIMLNPGSLSHDGRNLKRDSTLRILREVFQGTGFNPFVINLFDLATTSPEILFKSWDKRDRDTLVYEHLNFNMFKGKLFAYGSYETRPGVGNDIKKRISNLRSYLSHLPEVQINKNKDGTPKHPMSWQRQKLKGDIKSIISEFKTISNNF
ncbi:MAG: DUF1643 domain-containing protein [Nitrospirae bacterium]|nr:DUF1643 domain-containing protein [Nitrospirota bacterium]